MSHFENSFRGLCTNRACHEYAFGLAPEEPIPSFCPECGSPVIQSCPNCRTPIPELIHNPFVAGPNACRVCGEVLRRNVGTEFDPALP